MNVELKASPVRKINPTVRVLCRERNTVRKHTVHSHLDVRLSAHAARELRDQAHGRLGLLLASLSA